MPARIRATCQTPAIAISGYGMDADVKRSAAAGFAAHLTKPIVVPRDGPAPALARPVPRAETGPRRDSARRRPSSGAGS
jgi:CheY-like chemotaxis protein